MATIDCKAIAAKLKEEIKNDIAEAVSKYGEKPFLEIVNTNTQKSLLKPYHL